MNPLARNQSPQNQGTPGQPPRGGGQGAITDAVQIPSHLRLWAAERLVAAPNRRQAAQRLVDSAPVHGIDLSLMWGTLSPPPGRDEPPRLDPPPVRQVCLAVIGSGRTAMLFLSNPDPTGALGRALGTRQTQIDEISTSIAAALDGLGRYSPDRVTLAQTLIEPRHDWAADACARAGMICVGQLDYMRRKLRDDDRLPGPAPQWPAGIEVRPVTTLDPDAPDSDYQHLIDALGGSYVDTLDCPELCGLRTMPDVVESHRATGRYDPSRWYLIFKDAAPAGCCLLSHCPASRSVELVYLGIAPSARGMGLGKRVLSFAIGRLGGIDATEVTCAVDRRNAPAIGIYRALGFDRFDARVGFVAPIAAR